MSFARRVTLSKLNFLKLKGNNFARKPASLKEIPMSKVILRKYPNTHKYSCLNYQRTRIIPFSYKFIYDRTKPKIIPNYTFLHCFKSHFAKLMK